MISVFQDWQLGRGCTACTFLAFWKVWLVRLFDWSFVGFLFHIFLCFAFLMIIFFFICTIVPCCMSSSTEDLSASFCFICAAYWFPTPAKKCLVVFHLDDFLFTLTIKRFLPNAFPVEVKWDILCKHVNVEFIMGFHQSELVKWNWYLPNVLSV